LFLKTCQPILGRLSFNFYLERIIDLEAMKKLLMLFVLVLCCSLLSYGQKVYAVEYANQAEVKVFVVDYENQADLSVFKVEYSNQAGKNNGLWYFTDYKNQADKTIYYTDYENQADITIYFVEYSNQAGWNSNKKRHLFY